VAGLATWDHARLTTRVYIGLALLLLVFVALTAALWSESWAQTWMPNFIAEWSGILIAVAIVDRLLERARGEAEIARLEPLRLAAGRQMNFALYRLAKAFELRVVSASGADTSHLGVPALPQEPVAYIRTCLGQMAELPDPERKWAGQFADDLLACAVRLDRVLDVCEPALNPAQRLTVTGFGDVLRAAARSADPSELLTDLGFLDAAVFLLSLDDVSSVADELRAGGRNRRHSPGEPLRGTGRGDGDGREAVAHPRP
jgi:hypothetical protein